MKLSYIDSNIKREMEDIQLRNRIWRKVQQRLQNDKSQKSHLAYLQHFILWTVGFILLSLIVVSLLHCAGYKTLLLYPMYPGMHSLRGLPKALSP